MDLIHERGVSIKIFEIGEDRILIEGLLVDERFCPSFIYSRNQVVDPGMIHRMMVRMTLSLPKLIIESAEIEMAIIPNAKCREIEALSGKIVGLQLTQGFKRKVTELLGGKVGCIHIMNLILFMSSAAIQGSYTYYNRVREDGRVKRSDLDDSLLINSCHLWREDGPLARRLGEMKKVAKRIRAKS